LANPKRGGKRHNVTSAVKKMTHFVVPSVKELSGLVRVDGKRLDGSTLIPWHAGKAMAWDVTAVNTLTESYITLSASPDGAAEHVAHGQKICKIFISSTFTYIPAFGFGNTRTDQFYWNFLLHRAWPQVVRCLGRLSRNHILISASFFGGPALQLRSLQRNLYSSYRIGLATWFLFLTFVFNPPPKIFTTGGIKIKRN